MKTLYICYLGLLEPLVQTQVLPYLRLLADAGIDVTLLTFESTKSSSHDQEHWRDELAKQQIRWVSRRYHKRPSLPATMYDIAAGALLVSRLIRREGIRVLHARSHVPATMAILAKRNSGCRMLFDIRGFFPEEYVDAGIWPAGGFLYKLTKKVENALLAGADHCIVLTNRAREVLRSGAYPDLPINVPIEVIPCCVDFERFKRANGCRTSVRRELNVEGRQVLVYVGAMGGWYLSEQMADFLAAAHARKSTVFSLILTQSSVSQTIESLTRRGIPDDSFIVRTVAPADVPRYLCAADLAFCFIKPAYSKLSSSPTKIGEYLAAGLPVVCNSGIGDIDELLSTDRVGLLVRDFTQNSYTQALDDAERLVKEEDIAERCRQSARKHFDLRTIGGARYLEVYRRLGASLQEQVAGEHSAGSTRRI